MAGMTVPPTFQQLDLDALAHAISSDGVEQHHAEVAVLASAGVDAGVPAAVLAVLTDVTAAPVLRQRAFGRVAVMVDAHGLTSASVSVTGTPALGDLRQPALV